LARAETPHRRSERPPRLWNGEMARQRKTGETTRDGSEQERLRSIIDRLPDGIAIVSTDGVIRFANGAAERLFGRGSDDLCGRHLGFPVVAGESAEVEVVQPGGQPITAELRVVNTEWENEDALIVSLRDVSDRKRAEERAAMLNRERAARSEAEAASHAKSQFLALMSHELRTPLNAVIGYAELLDLGIGGPLSDGQRRQVARIRLSGQHLLGLVNEVLDLARVEAGRLTLHLGMGDSRRVIEGALTLVLPIAEGHDIELTSSSPADCEMAFEGDEDRVRQILVNLLNNAIKFTPAGGRVHVECAALERAPGEAKLIGAGPWIRFQVTDTGRGIPQEKLGAIFDPFVQVEKGHTRSKDGSGLGLTISRRLARLMNGDLTVASEPGKGATFSLWLRDGRAAAGRTARWYAASPEVAERLHGLGDIGKVLVRDLESLLNAFTARLREEPIVDGANAMRACQLSNHLIEYVAAIAATLLAVEEMQGEASAEIADAAKIQAAIAECHGRQRGQLGWSADRLHREWAILREEVDRLVRLHSRELLEPALAEATRIVERMIAQATDISARALERAALDRTATMPAHTRT
jgi:signal transduction histidine kinase